MKNIPSEFYTFENSKDEIRLFQKLIDTGEVWHLEGYYGRRAMELLEARLCQLGKTRFKDAYGNTVPSRYDVKAGTKGSPLNSKEKKSNDKTN